VCYPLLSASHTPSVTSAESASIDTKLFFRKKIEDIIGVPLLQVLREPQFHIPHLGCFISSGNVSEHSLGDLGTGVESAQSSFIEEGIVITFRIVGTVVVPRVVSRLPCTRKLTPLPPWLSVVTPRVEEGVPGVVGRWIPLTLVSRTLGEWWLSS
jgi:hypothetical protein